MVRADQASFLLFDGVLVVRLWAVVTLLLLVFPSLASGQISPGPLSAPHADLEGVLQCGKCHAIGLGRQELKCSSCHVEIAERVRSKRGYHAQVVDSSKGDAACVTCHNEHAGRDFALIRWAAPGKTRFDHTLAGFKLEGRHASLQCNQCHNAGNIAASQKSRILVKDLDRTLLGLGTTCLSCHTDKHRGELGSDCTSCHSQTAWKPVVQFDHSRTKFPLTGLHTKVSCEKCHHAETADATTRFKGLDFSECTGCHRDPHRGAFTATCGTCHSTSGWRVTRTALIQRFDHSRTRYPLTGKHASVECASCHKNSDFKRPVAANQCADCHADKHNGQFTKRTDRGDCKACHTVDGFQRSTFDVRAHAATKYPLLGKHAAVACDKCHAPTRGIVDYHPKSATCTDCHQDVHAGQFVARYGQKCESCHNVESFTSTTFTLVRHRESRFNLTGAHRAVACVECHNRPNDRAANRYLFEDHTCTSCHRGPHGLEGNQGRCETCHTVTAWKPALGFDHSSTRFPLLGQHRAVTCDSCHKPKTTGKETHVRFDGAPRQCAGCHEDIHAGQFTGRFGSEDCSGCHSSTLRWNPAAGFDHSRSAFPLDGAHRNVRCVLCHEAGSSINGRKTLVYRDAPTECAKCH